MKLLLAFGRWNEAICMHIQGAGAASSLMNTDAVEQNPKILGVKSILILQSGEVPSVVRETVSCTSMSVIGEVGAPGSQ